MVKKYQHNAKYVLAKTLKKGSVKTVIAMLVLELALLLFAVYKGFGSSYLPIALVFMVFTVIADSVVFYFKADRYLVVIVLILLDLGFVMQVAESGNGISIENFLGKFSVAIVAALGTAFLYRFLADILSKDIVVKGMMVLQIVICVVMLLAGKGSGAKISLGGITLFEIVKVLSPFIMANLLCKEGGQYFCIFKWNCKRERVMILHLIVLSIFFVLCSELGSLLVILATEFAMLWIYGKDRKMITALLIMFFTGFVSFWMVCDQILLQMLVKDGRNNALMKIVERFGAALHPENYISGAGYQGTLGLEALTVGGILGMDTERYRIRLPEAANDFIFANLVQTCGFLMGVIVIFFFFVLLKRGMKIASECLDTYFQGLVIAITLLIMIETVIHIGYNIAMFPITGIPLYFFSQGFLAVITGMVLTTILLVVSTGTVERRTG